MNKTEPAVYFIQFPGHGVVVRAVGWPVQTIQVVLQILTTHSLVYAIIIIATYLRERNCCVNICKQVYIFFLVSHFSIDVTLKQGTCTLKTFKWPQRAH